MLTTIQLLELAKQCLAARHGLSLPMSDYRLGKLLDLNQSTISHWRTGTSLIDFRYAAMFADAADLPIEYVLASLHHERTTDERVKGALERIAEKFRKVAIASTASVILSLGVGANTLENKAFSADLEPTRYALCASGKRRRRRKKTPAGTRPRTRALRRDPPETRP